MIILILVMARKQCKYGSGTQKLM